MEAFCNEVITDIKAASTETELINVIRRFISQFRTERNSYNESGYVINMLVSLRAMDKTGLSAEAQCNVTLATAIFKQFQKENRERIV